MANITSLLPTNRELGLLILPQGCLSVLLLRCSKGSAGRGFTLCPPGLLLPRTFGVRANVQVRSLPTARKHGTKNWRLRSLKISGMEATFINSSRAISCACSAKYQPRKPRGRIKVENGSGSALLERRGKSSRRSPEKYMSAKAVRY